MQKEARIILPQSCDATPFEHKLTDIFGGYTHTDGQGGWRDPMGLTSREPVNIYDIAAPDTCGTLESLAGVIGWLFETTNEWAIYCRVPSGDVAVVPRAKATGISITEFRRQQSW